MPILCGFFDRYDHEVLGDSAAAYPNKFLHAIDVLGALGSGTRSKANKLASALSKAQNLRTKAAKLSSKTKKASRFIAGANAIANKLEKTVKKTSASSAASPGTGKSLAPKKASPDSGSTKSPGFLPNILRSDKTKQVAKSPATIPALTSSTTNVTNTKAAPVPGLTVPAQSKSPIRRGKTKSGAAIKDSAPATPRAKKYVVGAFGPETTGKIEYSDAVLKDGKWHQHPDGVWRQWTGSSYVDLEQTQDTVLDTQTDLLSKLADANSGYFDVVDPFVDLYNSLPPAATKVISDGDKIYSWIDAIGNRFVDGAAGSLTDGQVGTILMLWNENIQPEITKWSDRSKIAVRMLGVDPAYLKNKIEGKVQPLQTAIARARTAASAAQSIDPVTASAATSAADAGQATLDAYNTASAANFANFDFEAWGAEADQNTAAANSAAAAAESAAKNPPKPDVDNTTDTTNTTTNAASGGGGGDGGTTGGGFDPFAGGLEAGGGDAGYGDPFAQEYEFESMDAFMNNEPPEGEDPFSGSRYDDLPEYGDSYGGFDFNAFDPYGPNPFLPEFNPYLDGGGFDPYGGFGPDPQQPVSDDSTESWNEFFDESSEE